MPRSLLRRLSGLVLITALVAACSKSTPTTPTTPTPDPISEPPYNGTLNVNGALTLTFATANAGSVTATVAALDPDPEGSLAIGLELGTWNGTQCQTVISNDNAGVGAGVIGAVTGSGTLCLRVHDVGTLTAPVVFTINIVHY
jgi:hypothetical protein